MKRLIIRVGLCFLWAIFFTYPVFSQGDVNDSGKYSLLTQAFVNRPINVYQGQFQLNMGYNMAMRTHSYDSEGVRIGLTEDGSASIIHNFIFDFRYGLFDFLELGTEIAYLKHGIREQTLNYFSGMDFTTINELTEYKGFEDLKFWVSIRLPIEYDFFDFALRGGLSLPTFEHQPDKPSHTIENISGLTYLINYHYVNKNGNGVMLYNSAALLKFRLNKFSVFAWGEYSIPSGEGTSIRWTQWLENDEFIYEQEPYAYKISPSIQINASVHYQPLGWLDIFIENSFFSSSGGWTEQYGNRYALPDKSLFYMQPGFEIQISPLIRLHEVVGFPISGQNVDAPFFIFTTISFNIIPFQN